MKPMRLDTLADGIFAIVMTLLVIDLKVPTVLEEVTNGALWGSLHTIGPALMTYFLSFAVLFTYWQAHHFIMGVYAKTVDRHLMNINGLFFVFVALVPFSTTFLGAHSDMQLAIGVYGVNIILIGLTLWWMRRHVLFNDHVESVELEQTELRHGLIRTLVPVMFALIAILVSFWSTFFSLMLFTLAIAFNLFKESTRLVDFLFGFDAPGEYYNR